MVVLLLSHCLFDNKVGEGLGDVKHEFVRLTSKQAGVAGLFIVTAAHNWQLW